MFRCVLGMILCLIPMAVFCKTPIFGNPEVEVEHMYAYVRRHNPDFKKEVAEAFYKVGIRYGIRGDIAMCQAIIETGWFKFDNGTAVSPKSHNYCGLGVKKRGDKGCSFNSVEEGVTAMIQHLYAYACSKQLPNGEKKIDPRFDYVSRGCAKTWEKLSGKWAMNSHYGSNILRIYSGLASNARKGKTVRYIEVDIPDDLLEENLQDADYAHDVDLPDVDIANIDLFN